MREVLFRGQRTDNGAWIEGTLYQIAKELNPFIMLVNRHAESHEVACESVGQYTGLKDRTGRNIFEGDIVQNHMGFIQVVVFETGCFEFIELDDYLYGERQGESFCACSKKYVDDGVTADVVINNIHDSRELLERYKADGDLSWGGRLEFEKCLGAAE